MSERSWNKYLNIAALVLEFVKALGIKVKFKSKKKEKKDAD